MISLIGSAISLIGSSISSYIGHKQRLVEAERHAELEMAQAKVELEITAQRQSIELAGADAASERAKRHTYIDEILIVGPILLMIYTVIDPATAKQYIEVFSSYPIWIQAIVVGIYIGVFGLRSIFTGLARFVKGK